MGRIRLLTLIAAVALCAPLWAGDAEPQAAVQPAASEEGQGVLLPYGTYWFQGRPEAEWSPFDLPVSPDNYWEAYTWGFVRFRHWFTAQRLGWGWGMSPFWSPLGWGYDPFYGGWYGWLPNGVPAGMSLGSWPYNGYCMSPVVPPLNVARILPAEAIAPRPVTRKKGKSGVRWFSRPAPSERMSNDPLDWGRGGSPEGDPWGHSGASRGSGGHRPSPVVRQAPAPSQRPLRPRR